MKRNLKVSIIINCFNGEQYLYFAVQSIFSQTYSNWEIIFWNNKSTDKSVEIIKSFKNEKIKIYNSSKFMKLYNARNEAIKKSTGDIICFLDCDDYWDKYKLEHQVRVFDNADASLVYTNFINVIGDVKKSKGIKVRKPSGYIPKLIFKRYLVTLSSLAVRRSVFDMYQFNENYNIIGDFDFVVNTSNNFNIQYLHQPLTYYRRHEGNYSKKNINEEVKELKIWLYEHSMYYTSYELQPISEKINYLELLILKQEKNLFKLLKFIFFNFNIKNLIKIIINR